MKPLCLALLVLVLAGCGADRGRYEYHTGLNGGVLYRCDRRTGKVDMMRADERVWRPVQEP